MNIRVSQYLKTVHLRWTSHICAKSIVTSVEKIRHEESLTFCTKQLIWSAQQINLHLNRDREMIQNLEYSRASLFLIFQKVNNILDFQRGLRLLDLTAFTHERCIQLGARQSSNIMVQIYVYQFTVTFDFHSQLETQCVG